MPARINKRREISNEKWAGTALEAIVLGSGVLVSEMVDEKCARSKPVAETSRETTQAHGITKDACVYPCAIGCCRMDI